MTGIRLTWHVDMLIISLYEQTQSQYSRRTPQAIQGGLRSEWQGYDHSGRQDRGGVRRENRKETEEITRREAGPQGGCTPNGP